jgi:hypothetical protein
VQERLHTFMRPRSCARQNNALKIYDFTASSSDPSRTGIDSILKEGNMRTIISSYRLINMLAYLLEPCHFAMSGPGPSARHQMVGASSDTPWAQSKSRHKGLQ